MIKEKGKHVDKFLNAYHHVEKINHPLIKIMTLILVNK